jgi:hypothetical protein
VAKAKWTTKSTEIKASTDADGTLTAVSRKCCTVEGCDLPNCARGLCRRHYNQAWRDARRVTPAPNPSVLDRLMSKIIVSQQQHAGVPCWLWAGATDKGYARIHVGGRVKRAHRLVYEALVGPVPDGLDIDHLCHDPGTCLGGPACPHRACLNPAHLRAVTRRENSAPSRGRGNGNRYKTHCIHGHKFTPENTIWHAGGTKRMCRECHRASYRKSAA